MALLDGVLADVETASVQTDIGMPWPISAAVTLIAELADVMDAQVVANAADANTQGGLETLIAALTAEMRTRAGDIAANAANAPPHGG